MITINKLDKAFGPTGSWAGIFLFAAGLVAIWFFISGLALILIGAFVGFTNTTAIIDSEGRRVKQSHMLFGIIPTGRWIPLEKDMKIVVKQSNQVWRSYSRGNRTLDVTESDYRLVLYDAYEKEIMQLAKSKNIDTAREQKIKLSEELGIGMIN